METLRNTLLCLSFVIGLTLTVSAQTQSFSREGVEFEMQFPSPSWRAVTRVDVHEHVEFINGTETGNGYLRCGRNWLQQAPPPQLCLPRKRS